MSLKSWASAIAPLFVLLLATAINSCGGNNPTPPVPYPGRLDPLIGQWTAYGTGTGATFIQRLPNPFGMPTPNVSVNYVYTAPVPLAVGKTMTLDYTVRASTFDTITFGTVDGGTPQLRLFIWQQNDQGGATFRWWCGTPAVLVLGSDQVLSCALDPLLWTDVNGQNNAAGFQAALANPYAIGFTFGGQFAGHGVWVTSGGATFKINSFIVN